MSSVPYVDTETRKRLNSTGKRTNHPQSVGQLTYDLQQRLKRYIDDRELSYQILAECLGALEGAKLDLTERVIKPYEARKCQTNGDVWPSSMTEPVVTHKCRNGEDGFQAMGVGPHTCHAECPCHTGRQPAPDFIGDFGE